MAAQQIIFAETIAGLKRALKRKSYESDSDDEVVGSSNRGNKLQRKARYVRQGQMTIPSGPEVYKEVVDHAGYQRTIINRNPLPVGEDGYELDSDDDEDHIQDALASAAETNPYSSIRLEHILAPLTAPSDLPNHPTMSRAYTSRTLTDLALQGRDIMHKENRSLWKVKHLLTQLCGDHPWVPTDLMEGENDLDLFVNGLLWPPATPEPNVPTTNPGAEESKSTPATATKHAPGESEDKMPPRRSTKTPGDNDATMPDVDTIVDKNKEAKVNGGSSKNDAARPGISKDQAEGPSEKMQGKVPNGRGKGKEFEMPVEMDIDRPVNGPPGKPAQASPEAQNEEAFIHPLFLQPESSRPDRDFFMPPEEAEELRRLLQLYVQRQEEICRGSRRLHEGLLKADRMRKMVFFWSKAEAHSGANRDMSDGEDWYDKEEWGLEEDLKKGHDDEEEEAQQNQKKTRNRR